MLSRTWYLLLLLLPCYLLLNHDYAVSLFFSFPKYIYIYIVSADVLYQAPRSITVEPDSQEQQLGCAVQGSYIPLDIPWSNSDGPLTEGEGITFSRTPENATSGVVVWTVKFSDVSKWLGNYTFCIPGIEDPLNFSIAQKVQGEWNVSCIII